MDTSRTSNSLKNMAFGVGSQMLSILMGFFTRCIAGERVSWSVRAIHQCTFTAFPCKLGI